MKDNWISVKELLPNKGQNVLCVQNPMTTATREPLFSTFDGKDFMPYVPYFARPTDLRIGKWVDIVCWMPLPKIRIKKIVEMI
jgi:hypothetical protein